MPDFAHERRHAGIVAGIDEAGRGPLAGPVVAAAVILDRWRTPHQLRDLLDDSKKLTRRAREAAFAALLQGASEGAARFAIGAASVGEIDRINILQATFLAMRRAVARLAIRPDCALVDGDRAPPDLGCRAVPLVGGDGASLSIAAASILAKVTRDRIMARLDRRHAGFGWVHNVGYGSPEHLAAIVRLGPTRHHRLSFSPLRQSILPFS